MKIQTALWGIILSVLCLAQAPAAVTNGVVYAWGRNDVGQTEIPSDATNIVAIAAGHNHVLALKANSTVEAWGENGFGEANVPAGLSNVVAVAAGYVHSLALKNDGTVAAWGDNGSGEASVPAGLSNVVAIAAGNFFSLALGNNGAVAAWGLDYNGQLTEARNASNIAAISANPANIYFAMGLKNDGTVVVWGSSPPNPPTGLSNVVQIATGGAHYMALKINGTVAVWGDNSYGQTNMPTGLSNVVAIAAGEEQSLALKADGTLVVWGGNSFGEDVSPFGLTNVTAISSGGDYNMILNDGTPSLLTWPTNQLVYLGTPLPLVLGVTPNSGPVATGFQWQFDGTNIPGATNTSLTFTNLQLADAGTYSVIGSNDFGTIVSSAMLMVSNSAPIIVQQPADQLVPATSNATFTINVVGSLPLSYQWQCNTTNIPGATNATFVVTNAQTDQSESIFNAVVSNAVGVVTTSNAMLNVVPALFTIQPQNLSTNGGATVVFSSAVLGQGPFSYQWLFEGTNLADGGQFSGSTNFALTITSVQPSNDGPYQVIVTNSFGTVTSAIASLTVYVAEQITGQPANEAVLLNGNARFTVADAGTTLSYQWYFNGMPLTDGGRVSGSTTATLNITGVQTTDDGRYWVVVSNSLNASASMPAVLTALTSPGPSIRYVNVNNTNPVLPYLDWSTAATNIQDAIDAAVAGDVILVTNGVYATGGRAVYGLTNRVAINQAVTVESVNGPAVTLIQGYQMPVRTNGNSAIRCVYMTNNAALLGFTLTNGATQLSYNSSPGSGGGLWCEATNNIVVSNCVISGNASWYYGGGVYQGSLVNCVITNNTCFYGWGGGTASAVLESCTVAGNVTAKDGGGAYQGTLSHCYITGNTAVGDSDNGIPGSGGGAYNTTVFGSVIMNNSASVLGGGAYGGILVNCTITKNFSTYSGGGAYNSTLTNCIIYFNYISSPSSNPSSTNYSYSSLYHCCTTPLAGGSGNITNDPVLVSNSHPGTNSPCLGAGVAISGHATDIDGNPWANPPSMGCAEIYPGNETGSVRVGISALFTNMAPGYAENFQADIYGPIYASAWDFGDGTVITNQPTASHAWSATGDYTVVLTAYSDSYPTGLTATLPIHVTVPSVYYVSIANTNPVAPYSSWNTAANNIQDAVDAAVPGSLILVTNKPYATNLIAIYNAGGRMINGSSNRVAITKPMTVQSVNGPGLTSIQGSAFGRASCVYMTNGAVLNGFTITNGSANGPSPVGGVWAESTNATVTNCIITSCQSGGAYSGTFYNCTICNNSNATYGSGAYLSTLYNCTLYHNGGGGWGGGAALCNLNSCTISSNEAAYGGGAYLCRLTNCLLNGNSASFGGAASGGFLTNCTLTGNSAMSGGGAFGDNSLGSNFILLVNCVVNKNNATFGGGILGILSSGSFSTNAVADGCILISNQASSYGGAAFDATLNDCAISNNLILGPIGSGGGVEGGVLSNCILENNSSYTLGGGADGFYVGSVQLSHCKLIFNTTSGSGGGASYATLIDCTLFGNSSFGINRGETLAGGGGAYDSLLLNCLIESNSAPGATISPGTGGGTLSSVLTNCILAFNSAGTNGGGDSLSTLANCTIVSNSSPLGGGIASSRLYNCIVYDNVGGNYCENSGGPFLLNYCCTTPATNGLGIITNDPAFVNLVAGDFHLQPNSPCINSGDNLYVTATNDLDGNPRIVGGTVDIGAYEYQTPTSVLSYAWAQQYGLPTDGSVDYQDLDGTGMNNWQKSIAGLNPTNPASVLVMFPPWVSNNAPGLVITWQSVSNRVYYLQRATDFSQIPAFTSIRSNIVGQTGTTSTIDISATNNSPYFYRVGVQ